jgi:hypothetical protein
MRWGRRASTRTAAAAAMQASVGQIVKSLVFKGKTTGKPHLILVSGSNRVQERAMAAVLGEAIIRPDAEFVRAATGFASAAYRRSVTPSRWRHSWTKTCCNTRRSGRRRGRPMRSSRSHQGRYKLL